MATESMWSVEARERQAVRRALAVQRACVRRCREALASAPGRDSRRRWSRQLQSSIDRAAKLALALVDMGEAVPMGDVAKEWDDDLLDAMDALRLADGPRKASPGRMDAGRRRANATWASMGRA